MKFIRNQKGFLLVSIMFVMILLAVTVFTVNYYSATQQRMTKNHQKAVQTAFSQHAVFQRSLWQLFKNPCFRTSVSGESFAYRGSDYTRKVINSDLNHHTDVVLIQVLSQGGVSPLIRGYRYYCKSITGQVQPQPNVKPGFKEPERIALDTAGNLFIADTDHHRVVKRDAAGNMTIFAGTEQDGYSGDGGLAVNAKMSHPSGLCLDPAGNLYIADRTKNRVRRVDTAGKIKRVAGGGDEDLDEIEEEDDDDDDDAIRATEVELDGPRAVFYHSGTGSLYIADTDDHCILRMDSSGFITIVAGRPENRGYRGDGHRATSAKLRNPQGVCVTPAGVIYIADTGNHVIRQVDTSGIITTIAGTGDGALGGDGGQADAAQLKKPSDVATDENGNLYIVDTGNHRVRFVCASDHVITTLVGTGKGYNDDIPASAAMLEEPVGIALPSAQSGKAFYISDTKNDAVRHIRFELDPAF